MKQVALIPSGCSVASLMQFTTKYFFYASSLTVYAINNETFCIEKILPASQQRIVSFSVNPHDSNILSSVDSEGMLMLWNVEEVVLFKLKCHAFLYRYVITFCRRYVCKRLALK